MENILEMQKKRVKKMLPLFIFMWVMTLLVVVLTVPLGLSSEEDVSILFIPAALLVVVVLLTVFLGVLPCKKLHASVLKLSAEALRTANAECLSGTCIGNGVVTRSGYVFIVAGKARVIEPENIIWVYSSSMTYTSGLIPAATQTSLNVIDRDHRTYQINVKTQAFLGSNAMKKPNALEFLEALMRAVPDAYYGYTPENQAIAANFEQMVKNVDVKRAARLRQ